MSGALPLARVFVAGALFVTAGCVRWTHLAPSDLQIHGKVGQVCSAAVTPLVWSLNTVLFPLSVASLGLEPPSHDNLGYPGLAVENGAYFLCTTLGLPLHALDRGAERAFFLLADREAIEDHLIERLPDLSPEDYTHLLRTARRTCPPLYDQESAPPPPSAPGTSSPRDFGLWSTGQAPRYGSKPRLGNSLAAAEWRDWRAAGRPRDADTETIFIVNRALEFSDPALQFAATYGLANQARFERELASQQSRAAALTGAGEVAALHDPSPALRAAAARRLTSSGDKGVTGELTPLLKDRAVMVRVEAAEGLASHGDPESVAALGRAMSDPGRLVRERATLALGKIGSGAAVDLLLRSLGNVGHRARFLALCALADAGRPQAAEALSRALADRDLHTRIAAAAAIGRTAADTDDPLLRRALSDPDPRISGAAAHAHERRGEPDASCEDSIGR